MKNPRLPRLLKRQSILCLAAAVAASVFASIPASAQETEDPGCTTEDGALVERGESAALALAATCDSEVLIRESQDYTVRSFAQPDGTVATEFSVVPQWVPDASGEWIDADSTIEVAEDGTIQSAATVSDLEFASAGETEFVTATNTDGESVSLSWPEPLPEPVVEGDTVTYPEVLPDVDLEVYSGVADFSYALVVKTPEAAADPELERIELGLDTEGLSVATDEPADTASLTDASGETAFSVASPWMWDSSETTAGAPELAAPMELEMDDDSLAVIPDQEALTHPEAEYPIYIDPKFTDSSVGWENTWSQGDAIQCGDGEMCTGRQTWRVDGTYGQWRTAMQFNNLQSIADREIQDVTVRIDQTHTGDAGGPNQTVRLAAMDYFSTGSGISWDDFDDLVVGEVARDSVPTSNDNYGESDQTITWTDDPIADRIQQLVDQNANTATFAVISGANGDQEGDQDYWRKLDQGSATMTVWHAPLKPTNLYADGKSCSTSAPGPVINTLTPTLKGTAPSNLEPNNRISFYLYERDKSHPNAIQQFDANDVADGQVLRFSVASGELERGKTYRWNARAWDSDGDSSRYGAFSSYCYFTVNSIPDTPTDLSSEGLGCGTRTDPTPLTTLTPKLSSIPDDPDGGTVWAKYRFYAETGDNIREWTVKVQAGNTASTRVPSGLATADGLYRWRVITDDAFTSSAAWSSYCWIEVDTTSPEPPDVVQATAQPLPGEAVEFEFVGDDGVTGFEYALEDQTRQSVSAADGQTKVSVTPSTSAVDHALEVWAVDAAGNTSSPTTYWFTTVESQQPQAIGAWRFDGDLLDDASDQDLSALGTESFTADRADRSDAAALFDGQPGSCLTAEGPIVDSSSSVTFAAWARSDGPTGESQAAMDVTSSLGSSLKLELAPSGRWKFTMSSSDADGVTWIGAGAPEESTEYGAWTHIAGVYDAAAARLRIYVNGLLKNSVTIPAAPWDASGFFSVGCGVMPDGDDFLRFNGAVDDAVLFQEVLTGEQIAELMDGHGMPSALQAWYPLHGDATDHSGRAADLTVMPVAPVWTADQYGRATSALEFDGSACPAAGAVPVRTDSAFSVAAWVYLDADHVAQHPPVFSFYGDQASSFALKYNGTVGKWEFFTRDSDSADAGYAGAVSAESVAADTWTHLVAVFDPQANELYLYVDGELSGSRSLTHAVWRANALSIGCFGGDAAGDEGWDGAISDVRVWRGALDADEVAASHTEQLSRWELGQDELGTDQWGSSDLTVNGDYSWEVDRYNQCWAAYGLALGGTGWAETSDPVVATDESFTVAAWARVDDLSEYRAIVAQSGTDYGAFTIEYSPQEGRFQLAMPQTDSESAKWQKVGALEAPEIDESTGLGTWYHLAAQVDLGAGVMRFYVDGVLQGEAPVVDSPWQAGGPLTIGAAEQSGVMTNQMVGAIDSVKTWSGVLDPLSIAALAADRPDFELDPTDVDCEGSEEPPVDL